MPWSTPPPPIYWKEAKIQDRLVSTWRKNPISPLQQKPNEN